MGQFYKGIVLILMMFGHNFVVNQPQAMQEYLQEKHKVTVTQFNLLYSLPSAISILFIIPLGVLYDKYSLKILLIGAFFLLIGQILITIFSPSDRQHAFEILVGGRVLQGVGAQVLYMIQGNLASTWMGKLAGLIFILPQVGQIANSFGTPLIATQLNHQIALLVGLLSCLISTVACLILYCYLKKKHKQSKAQKGSSTQLNIKSTVHLEKSQKSQSEFMNQQHNEQVSSQNRNQNGSTKHEETLQKINNKKSCLTKCRQSLDVFNNLKQVLKAGKVFWLTIAVCAINECLYFPFMDNANLLLQRRFFISYQATGLYLCIPFISAIFITAAHGQYILQRFSRKSLIYVCSFFPLFAHSLIYLMGNQQQSTSYLTIILLIIALWLFGMGLGSYYSVSFPAVGYAVPSKIRGTAYACLCFFQTISMTLVPIISGKIITVERNISGDSQSYKNSSLLFVILCLVGVVFSYLVYRKADDLSFQYDDYEEQVETSEFAQKDQNLQI